MAVNASGHNIAVTISSKVIALVLIIFVCGLVSGILIYQELNKNISQTASENSLELSNSHVWFDNTWSYLTEAAIVMVNSGNADAKIMKVTVREIECNWTDVYHWETQIAPMSNLSHPSTEIAGTTFNMVVDGIQRTFQQSTGAFVLRPLWASVLVMKNVGNMTMQDIPDVVVIAVFTENRFFYKEAVIDASFTFMATERGQVTNLQFDTAAGTIRGTFQNTGTTPITINEVWVNGVKQNTF